MRRGRGIDCPHGPGKPNMGYDRINWLDPLAQRADGKREGNWIRGLVQRLRKFRSCARL